MRRWRRLRGYVETARGFVLVLLTLSMRVMEEIKRHTCCVCGFVSVVVIWLIYSSHDPCLGKKITAKLCNDYFHGEISGHLCSSLCRDYSVYLSICLENGAQMSFWWDNMVMRVPADIEHYERDLILMEGMLPSEFLALLLDYLQQQLGPGDFSGLAEKLKTFADFNEDGKLSLGEAQSVWRLLHNREFLILFIFQHSYAFPSINGTCGSLFGFQLPDVSTIYDKDVFPLHLLSSNAYRWFLPAWEQRAKVALGILDLMFDIYEDNRIKFFICDINPKTIGYSLKTHEAVVTDARQVMSSAMLARALKNHTCSHDHHCHYSSYCTTVCDTLRQRCTGEVTKPTLWQACHLLTEYLLFDTPQEMRPTLELLLQRCSHLIVYGQSIDLSHIVLITDLKTVFWNHIKNKNVSLLHNPQISACQIYKLQQGIDRNGELSQLQYHLCLSHFLPDHESDDDDNPQPGGAELIV